MKEAIVIWSNDRTVRGRFLCARRSLRQPPSSSPERLRHAGGVASMVDYEVGRGGEGVRFPCADGDERKEQQRVGSKPDYN